MGTCQDEPAATRWQAKLDLHLVERDGRTVLAHNHHHGPLRVQKLLHPAADEPAQLLLVHPPGGIAGGDELHLDVRIEGPASALLTTPGATRWYRSQGPRAAQHVHLRIAAGAALEWLPQDNIVQEQARGHASLCVEMDADAAFLGWDLVQLGQPLAQRSWRHGEWSQRCELRRAGRLLLAEQGCFTPADLHAPALQRLAGHSVMATLWATGGGLSADADRLLERCRELCSPSSDLIAGVSWLEAPTACLVVRALGHDAQALRQRLINVWKVLRPTVIGCDARIPRIWKT